MHSECELTMKHVQKNINNYFERPYISHLISSGDMTVDGIQIEMLE